MQDIPKSQIASLPDFEVRVANHASMTRQWKEHQSKVEADERNGVTGPAKHVAFKAPRALPIVESAVDADGNANYRIIDDGPTAAEKLEAKKQELEHRLRLTEETAIEAIAPRRQSHVLAIRENDIANAHAARCELVQSKGFMKFLTGEQPQMPADDAAFLDAQEARRQRVDAIRRVFAQALADIDALTVQTIDAWQLPTF